MRKDGCEVSRVYLGDDLVGERLARVRKSSHGLTMSSFTNVVRHPGSMGVP